MKQLFKNPMEQSIETVTIQNPVEETIEETLKQTIEQTIEQPVGNNQ